MRAIVSLLCLVTVGHGRRTRIGGASESEQRRLSKNAESELRPPVDGFQITAPFNVLAQLLLTCKSHVGWRIAKHGLNNAHRRTQTTQFDAVMAVRPKRTECRSGPNYEAPDRIEPVAPPGPRDVVLKLYDISTPEVCQAMSVLAFKPAYWFPKLSVGVGRRTWSYDGVPEATYDKIIENAAGGPPLRTWNLGATKLSDSEIDEMLEEMGSTDYNPEEYEFFMRNCNHFCVDLAERLAPGGLSAEDEEFLDGRVLHESEAILNKMPLGEIQQAATRTVTRSLQKIIVKAWRSKWKKALREFEEEQNIPTEQRIVAEAEE